MLNSPSHKKNTLLKTAASHRTTKVFKRVFFSPTQEEIQIIFFPTLRFFNYLFFQRTVQTLTDIALNVNRFEQSVCELPTTHLRTDSKAADNNQGFVACGARTMKPMLHRTFGSFWR